MKMGKLVLCALCGILAPSALKGATMATTDYVNSRIAAATNYTDNATNALWSAGVSPALAATNDFIRSTNGHAYATLRLHGDLQWNSGAYWSSGGFEEHDEQTGEWTTSFLPLAGRSDNGYRLNHTLTRFDDLWAATNALGVAIAARLENYATLDDLDAATPADYETVKAQVAANTDGIATNAADIATLQSESALIYHLYSASNVVCEVTNYNSTAHAPAMSLLQLNPTNEAYFTVWAETNGLARTLADANTYTDAATNALAVSTRVAIATRAPAAWSGTTSGLGAQAPENTTWISTPQTILAGGLEFQRTATTAGAVWVLKTNGMIAELGNAANATNAYFRITDLDGETQFEIVKSSSYAVGADADGITATGSGCTVHYSIVGAHPNLRIGTDLKEVDDFAKEEDGIPASLATVEWGGESGDWTATITSASPSLFVWAEYLKEGTNLIRNNAATDLSGGIYFNGVKYMPAVNGNKLEFIAN